MASAGGRRPQRSSGPQRLRLRYVGRVLSPRRIPVAALALAAAAAAGGCGDDDPVPADERPALTQTVAPETTAPPETALATAPPAQTATTATGTACGALRGLRLLLVGGRPGCEEVRRVAEGYDLAGAKLQDVGGWTCATATAQARPVVFTCTRGAEEFVAREPGD